MRKPNLSGMGVNNSNSPSIQQTGTVNIPYLSAANILDLANDLQGEEALEDLSNLLSNPNDEQIRGFALESILRFYINARILTKAINKNLKIK